MKYSWILMLLAMAVVASPTQAAIISNCDKEPREVHINNAGELRVTVLAPGQSTYAGGGMVDASVPGGPVLRIKQRDTYCIWSGKLSPQMRRPIKDRN